MAFWGIEVKPGKPYTHLYDEEKGRLHVSQATLLAGSSDKRSMLQCNVGDNKPIFLCSLLPEKIEFCALNLELEEEEEVTFSVIGPHSVHLSGFFYGVDNEDEDHMGDDCCLNHHSDDDLSDDLSDYDSDEDDDFIFDDDDDSPVRSSGVTIEEILDEEKPRMSKQEKKKKGQLSLSNNNENSNCQIVASTKTGTPLMESEDEDGFPKSDSKVEETKKTMGKEEITLGKLKRKIDAVVGHDEEPTRENNDSQMGTITPENEVKGKKNKKNKKKKLAEKEESAQQSGGPKSDGLEHSPVAEIGKDIKSTSQNNKEKKKKKQNQQDAVTPNTEGKVTNKKEVAAENQENEGAKSQQVRTYPNGLVIEEVAMGKPAGKKASPGKKVSVKYTGKLKKNGKIFDSNVLKPPFKFRLGIGEVIKGWDIGVSGMRVGDKRRLTIPPAMGYGAKGCGTIPPNAWLIFDVELIDVN